MSSKQIPGYYWVSKKEYGLEAVKFQNVTTGYVADRKFVKFAIESVRPEQFQEVTGITLRQTHGNPCSSVRELMFNEIETKLFNKSSKYSIELWEMALHKGIITALKKLYKKK